jgi:hypothetical protein
MQLKRLKEKQHASPYIIRLPVHDNATPPFVDKQEFAALMPVVIPFEEIVRRDTVAPRQNGSVKNDWLEQPVHFASSSNDDKIQTFSDIVSQLFA